MAICSLEKYFFKYEEKSTYVSAQGLMMLKLKSEKENLVFKNSKVESMYQNCINGYVSPKNGTEFCKELICNYFDGRYCDDQTFFQDVKTKKSLKKLLLILNENKNVLCLNNATKSTLLHILNELDRNIRNHSGFMDSDKTHYEYMFMVYPKSSQLSIVLLDRGDGIHGSLTCKSNQDPVIESIKNGVSAHSNHNMTDGGGQNSGYGLYLMNELSKKNHILEIVDNKRYYCSEKNCGLMYNEIGNNYLKNLGKFTMVSLIIDLDTISNDLLEIDNNTEGKSSKSTAIKFTNVEFEQLTKIIRTEV